MTTARDIMTPDVTWVAEVLQTMARHQVDVARALPDRPVGDLIEAISAS